MDRSLYYVDRIEQNIAVCETKDGATISIPLSQIITIPKEGDCLIQTAQGRYEVDSAQTQQRRKLILELQRKIFSD